MDKKNFEELKKHGTIREKKYLMGLMRNVEVDFRGYVSKITEDVHHGAANLVGSNFGIPIYSKSSEIGVFLLKIVPDEKRLDFDIPLYMRADSEHAKNLLEEYRSGKKLKIAGTYFEINAFPFPHPLSYRVVANIRINGTNYEVSFLESLFNPSKYEINQKKQLS